MEEVVLEPSQDIPIRLGHLKNWEMYTSDLSNEPNARHSSRFTKPNAKKKKLKSRKRNKLTRKQKQRTRNK